MQNKLQAHNKNKLYGHHRSTVSKASLGYKVSSNSAQVAYTDVNLNKQMNKQPPPKTTKNPANTMNNNKSPDQAGNVAQCKSAQTA